MAMSLVDSRICAASRWVKSFLFVNLSPHFVNQIRRVLKRGAIYSAVERHWPKLAGHDELQAPERKQTP
jgi:hypothetical protein